MPSDTPSDRTGATGAALAAARLLKVYVFAGLFFLVLPGPPPGAWNLLQVREPGALGAVSAAWLQAHGHAQVFGWIGCFILGIGFQSLPTLRTPGATSTRIAWTSLLLWTAGVTIR